MKTFTLFQKTAALAAVLTLLIMLFLIPRPAHAAGQALTGTMKPLPAGPRVGTPTPLTGAINPSPAIGAIGAQGQGFTGAMTPVNINIPKTGTSIALTGTSGPKGIMAVVNLFQLTFK